ncbi:WD40 repeat domain-containing protein [Fimbriiglobus ruber]|uniref:High-affnity carbon uptake protein Hat/HatR n=1 Tax=Fimbriiglobus ruber TaxID=1908690 RepID=A0A225DKH6_9BACT|nr:WD40 repeat domain-containing protein [Fimbriiglobus ruber]OWK37966.1 High-affnity carbon uptake protein Hat/HatR [Fimbriiglobus ruber]
MSTSHPDRREFLLAGAATLATGYADLTATPVRPSAPIPTTPDPPLPAGMIARFASPRFRCPEIPIALKLSPQGKYVLAFTETTLFVFETVTGRMTGELARPKGLQLSPAFSNEHTVVFPGTLSDGPNLDLLRVDLRSAAVQRITTAIRVSETWTAVVSPDATAVAVLLDGKLSLHELPSAKVVWSAVGLTADNPQPCFSPSGRFLAVAKTDANKNTEAVVVHDARSGAVVFWFGCFVSELESVYPQVLEFTPDGIGVTYRGFRKKTVWDLWTGTPRDLGVKPHVVAFIGLGKYVRRPTGEGAGLFEAVEMGSAGSVRTFETSPSVNGELACPVVANATVAVAAQTGGGITVWDTGTGKILPQSASPPRALISPRFSPTGQLSARCWWSHQITSYWSWNPTTGSARELGAWSRAWLSPDEQYLAKIVGSGKGDGYRVDVFEARDGKRVASLPIPNDKGTDVGFSGDGDLFGVADETHLWVQRIGDGRKRIVDIPRNKGQKYFTCDVELSHNGHVALVSRKILDHLSRYEICVVAVRAGKVLHQLTVKGMDVDGSVSPDGTRFSLVITPEVVYGEDVPQARLKIYRVSTDREPVAIEYPNDIPVAHEYWGRFHPFAARFSPDNRAVVAAGSPYEVTVREVAGGAERVKYRTRGIVTGAEFSPDGTAIAITTYDTPIALWDYRGLRATHPTPDRAAVRRAWDELASADAVHGFAAIQTMTRSPSLSLPLLREQLPPAVRISATRVRQLVADLDANDYPTRALADTALRGIADHAARLLQAEYDCATVPEVRRQLGAILSPPPWLVPRQLLVIRAVEAVEWIGTPDAVRLLRAWADGAPGALLTTEAQAALRRVQASPG